MIRNTRSNEFKMTLVDVSKKKKNPSIRVPMSRMCHPCCDVLVMPSFSACVCHVNTKGSREVRRSKSYFVSIWPPHLESIFSSVKTDMPSAIASCPSVENSRRSNWTSAVYMTLVRRSKSCLDMLVLTQCSIGVNATIYFVGSST